MHVEVLDPARVSEVVAVLQSAQSHDRPDDPAYAPRHEALRILHPTPDEPTTHWVAVDGGRIVGHAQLTTPQLDNTGGALVEVTVHPDARRRGAGRLLWNHVTDLALADDRKQIYFEARMGSAGESFARAVGADLGIHSARRRLIVDDSVRDLARALRTRAEEHATRADAGYRVHSFIGATPDEFAEGVAYLNGRMSTDAPLDDLTWEPEVYTVDRIRGREAAAAKQGLVIYTTVVVDAYGAVAGFTNIGMALEDPTHGWQWNTIVDPDHRGHRLGMWMKTTNLLQLCGDRPQLRTLLTWNAVSNGPMIAVNEAMGFRLWDHWGEWQAGL